MRSISILPSDTISGVQPGPAPMLQWLKIADLVIDDSYQRELRRTNWTAIRKIAAAFTWSRFSPVFVAPVEGGKYAIIDGQHRTHAAAMCGFEDVPCQIVQMSAAEQADAFAAVNGMVTKITSLQIFKAALAAGSGWATELRDLAHKAGCEVRTSNGSSDAKRPGQIYAVSAFRVLAGRYGGGIVPALKAMMSLPGWKDDARYWDANIFGPVLSAFCQRPKAITREDFAEGFTDFDIWAEIGKAKAEKTARMRAGQPPVSARDLLESQIIDFISKRFPERPGVVTPPASRADIMARIGKISGG